MQLERQFKIALDESRLLILGAQVLFGFQFNGVFQDQFKELPSASRTVICAGLFLLVLAVALLIAPSMQHRIVERGQDSPRVLALATLFAGTALLPISIALAFDVFVAMERIFSISTAVLAGAVFFVLALLFWYMLEWLVKRRGQPMSQQDSAKPTPLATQVDQLLTEARVIIPGVQALLGFQLTVTLTQAFQEFPGRAKVRPCDRPVLRRTCRHSSDGAGIAAPNLVWRARRSGVYKDRERFRRCRAPPSRIWNRP